MLIWERRLQPRWPLRYPAELKTAETSHQVLMSDLSFGGAGLIDGSFESSGESAAKLQVSTPFGEHRLDVRIVYDRGGSQRRFGVQFCGAANQIAKTVAAVVRELELDV